MKTRNVLLVVGLLLSLGCVRLWGSECRFFRITCLDGGAPENLRITKDEFGQIFLQFDTEDQRTYIIEAADSLSPPPAWAGVSAMVGDGQRATWLTTRRWSRTLGGDGVACSVQQTSDGGYILVGDQVLIKTDQNGDEDWRRPIPGTSLQQTSDGGYVVVGSYLIKTHQNGNEDWSRPIAGSCVHQTSDGGYIVAGSSSSFGAGNYDVYLIKTDANGAIGKTGWTRTFGGTGDAFGRSVQQTSDGGYIVAGSTGGPPDVYLIKADARGNEVWSKIFGGTALDTAHSVQQTSDGGYIVAGVTRSFGAGGYDAYLIKTDQDGNAPPPEPTLVCVVVSGPGQVNENSSADCIATAVWDDGSTEDVTDSAAWSPDSGAHYFTSPGHLVTGEVASDEPITLSASFEGQTGVKNITVKNIPPILTSVTISGPDEVDENSSADYTATAHYEDASEEDVSDSASWSPDSGKHYFSSPGHPLTSEVSSDEPLALSASFEGQTGVKNITVKNVPILTSVTISGPKEVFENSSADYTATAHWDDGSTEDVTSSASWSPDSGTHYFSSPGHLVTGEVALDEPLTVSASYEGQTGVKDMTVKNVPILTSVTISGPDEVNENSSAEYAATAHWDDGSTGDVTSSASWSPDSGKHYFSSPGHLITGEVTADEHLTISASYGGKSGTKSVTVRQTPVVVVWSKTFSGGWGANSVQQTSDGGYIVAGTTWTLGAGGSDVYLLRTDADGNEVWTRTFGGTNNDEANSVEQTSDGGYIVVGRKYISGAQFDVYLIKTDENGNAPPPE